MFCKGALLFFVWEESPDVRATCFSACWRGFVFIARLRDKTVVDFGWLFLVVVGVFRGALLFVRGVGKEGDFFCGGRGFYRRNWCFIVQFANYGCETIWDSYLRR